MLHFDDPTLVALLDSLERQAGESSGARLERIKFVLEILWYARCLETSALFPKLLSLGESLAADIDASSNLALIAFKALRPKVAHTLAVVHAREEDAHRDHAQVIANFEQINGNVSKAIAELEAAPAVADKALADAFLNFTMALESAKGSAAQEETVSSHEALEKAELLRVFTYQVLSVSALIGHLEQLLRSSSSTVPRGRVEFALAFARELLDRTDRRDFDKLLTMAQLLLEKLERSTGPSWWAVNLLLSWANSAELWASSAPAHEVSAEMHEATKEVAGTVKRALSALDHRKDPNDERLIDPILVAGGELCLLQDRESFSWGAVQIVLRNVKELERVANVAEDYSLTSNSAPAHSIGRRAAQRLGIDRARFIAQANAF